MSVAPGTWRRGGRGVGVPSRFVALALLAALGLPACGDDPGHQMASPEQIRAAAERCGLRGFSGNPAGDYWDASVPHEVANWVVIEDCIYEDLGRQGLVATRAWIEQEWEAARKASNCPRDPISNQCTLHRRNPDPTAGSVHDATIPADPKL
jgi:hypothetical protein